MINFSQPMLHGLFIFYEVFVSNGYDMDMGVDAWHSKLVKVKKKIEKIAVDT